MITKTQQFESTNTKALFMAIKKEKLIAVNLIFILINVVTRKSARGGGGGSNVSKYEVSKKEWICFYHGRFCQQNTDGVSDRKEWRVTFRLVTPRDPFLGVFVKLRKATICFVVDACLPVRPSARMEQLGSQWADFNEICHLSILRKSVEEIKVSLKSDKHNGYFTWRRMYIYGNNSLSSSQNEKCFKRML